MLVTLHEIGELPQVLPCISVQVSQRITLGDSASITTKVLTGDLPDVARRFVNKWVTVGTAAGGRIFLGRVVNVSVGKMTTDTGLVMSREVTLDCQSWWYLLKESLLVPAPASAVDAVPGFIIKFDEWRQTLQVLFSVVRVRGPGAVLEELFQLWARVRVPESITKAPVGTELTLADVIRVEWEEDPVLGLALNAFGNTMLDASVGQMLAGTFTADPSLVELYETPERLIYRMKPFLRAHADAARYAGSAENYSLNFSDLNRVNAHFVTTALTTNARYGDWGFLGGPIVERESIIRNGLRIKDHVWPFFPNPNKSTFKVEADKLIRRAEEMYRDDHLFGSGVISGMRLDVSLEPGEWYYLDDGLVFYVTEVTHSWRMSSGGPHIIARTSLKFTRARYGGYKDLPPGSTFEAPYTDLPYDIGSLA